MELDARHQPYNEASDRPFFHRYSAFGPFYRPRVHRFARPSSRATQRRHHPFADFSPKGGQNIFVSSPRGGRRQSCSDFVSRVLAGCPATRRRVTGQGRQSDASLTSMGTGRLGTGCPVHLLGPEGQSAPGTDRSTPRNDTLLSSAWCSTKMLHQVAAAAFQGRTRPKAIVDGHFSTTEPARARDVATPPGIAVPELRAASSRACSRRKTHHAAGRTARGGRGRRLRAVPGGGFDRPCREFRPPRSATKAGAPRGAACAVEIGTDPPTAPKHRRTAPRRLLSGLGTALGRAARIRDADSRWPWL